MCWVYREFGPAADPAVVFFLGQAKHTLSDWASVPGSIGEVSSGC
jgi:hypothetical protein